MRLEGGVPLEFGAIEGRNSTLVCGQTSRVYTQIGFISYIFVAGPEKLLRGIEDHSRYRCRQCVDAWRRERYPDDLDAPL